MRIPDKKHKKTCLSHYFYCFLSVRAVLLQAIILCFTFNGLALAQPIQIGVAVPLSGEFATLGRQWVDGARLASQASGMRTIEADTACDVEKGKAAAEALISAKVAIVIGYFCTESAEAALPLLKSADIPLLTPVRTANLTQSRHNWPVFRIAPRSDLEAKAIAKILLPLWRKNLFAIVDDGTIYGRELAETLRAEAELIGLKPVFFDSYRSLMDNQIALVGRLRRAGATHVFVGGDRQDTAIMARDAEELDYQVQFAGGESLHSAEGAVPLPEGILMIGLPDPYRLAPDPVLHEISAAGVVPEDYVLLGYSAAQIADEALKLAGKQQTSLLETLHTGSFPSILGNIQFDALGDLKESPYRLFRYDGTDFVEQ